MDRRIVGIAMAASLSLLGSSTPAEVTAQRAPLAKPGDVYVSLQVEGCTNKCPSFEIYVFKNGRMVFRSNNQYTSTKGVQYRNGMAETYNTIAKYLQDTGAFTSQAACATQDANTSVATVQSAHDSQLESATWSSSCPDQRTRGRGAAKVFVNQTGMWRLIRSDMDWWQKYWEDPERTGRDDVVQ